MDLFRARVFGPSNLRISDARVFWRDGYLYIARKPTDVIALETPEPTKRGSQYKSGELRIVSQCGSCRAPAVTKELRAMSQEQIMVLAEGETGGVAVGADQVR